MYKAPSAYRQPSLFWDLEAMLNPKKPLFKLTNLILVAFKQNKTSWLFFRAD